MGWRRGWGMLPRVARTSGSILHGAYGDSDVRAPRKLHFMLRHPHTAARVLAELKARGMLPLRA